MDGRKREKWNELVNKIQVLLISQSKKTDMYK